MSDEPTIKIKLKDPLKGLEGEIMKQPQKLRNSDKFKKLTDMEFNDQIKDLSPDALLQQCPNMTLGDGLIQILSQGIRAKTNEDAAKIFSYITKMNNILHKDKAEWSVDKEDLKRFMELLNSATENISVNLNGQIHNIIEDYNAQLITQLK